MSASDECVKYAAEEHFCPHCNQRLSCCQAPPFHVGDGLGWGSEVMFLCLNDLCPLYVNGWQHIEQQYAHTGSYRYMLLPGAAKGEAIMVGSKDAYTGNIIDLEAMRTQNERFTREKESIAALANCVENRDLEPVLYLITDEAAAPEARAEACGKLITLNDLCCIDRIRNHSFRNTDIEFKANEAVALILKANFRKECPFCMEVIKAQAKICMHCQKAV